MTTPNNESSGTTPMREDEPMTTAEMVVAMRNEEVQNLRDENTKLRDSLTKYMEAFALVNDTVNSEPAGRILKAYTSLPDQPVCKHNPEEPEPMSQKTATCPTCHKPDVPLDDSGRLIEHYWTRDYERMGYEETCTGSGTEPASNPLARCEDWQPPSSASLTEPTPLADTFEAAGSPYSIRLYRPEQKRILDFARTLERRLARAETELRQLLNNPCNAKVQETARTLLAEHKEQQL